MTTFILLILIVIAIGIGIMIYCLEDIKHSVNETNELLEEILNNLKNTHCS